MKFLLLLLVFCAGCRSTSDPVYESVFVTTNKVEYAVGETIAVTVLNDSDQKIRLHHCNFRIGLAIERRENGSWVESLSVHGPLCPANLPNGRFDVLKDEARTEAFALKHPGDYRVRIDVETEGSATPIPIRSSAFAVGE